VLEARWKAGEGISLKAAYYVCIAHKKTVAEKLLQTEQS
jgi:hypothetical protein